MKVNGSWGDTHFLLGGCFAPPKRKCDRPKNLEVFLVNFQIRYIALPFYYIFIYLFFIFILFYFYFFIFILFYFSLSLPNSKSNGHPYIQTYMQLYVVRLFDCLNFKKWLQTHGNSSLCIKITKTFKIQLKKFVWRTSGLQDFRRLYLFKVDMSRNLLFES